jgi:hypothetical protein
LRRCWRSRQAQAPSSASPRLPAIDGEWKHYSITLQENPADTPLTDGNGWLVITNTLAALPLLLSAPFGLGFARRGRTSG